MAESTKFYELRLAERKAGRAIRILPTLKKYAQVRVIRSEGRFSMKKVTLTSYKKDPYYAKIMGAVGEILTEKEVVTPLEVLVHMQLLTRDDLEGWLRGRIPYLELV